MKKRILSFLLALTMVVSLLPVSVLADELETETPEAEAVLPEANTPEANTPEEAPEASEQKEDAAPAPELVSEAAPEFAMTLANSASDFAIDDSGRLSAYYGQGGHVEIPDNVTAIGRAVFYNKNITSVTIPAGVDTVGESAFASCGQLNSVTFKSYPSWYFDAYAFYGVGEDSPCSLILPADWPVGDMPGDGGYWHGGYFVVVAGEPEEPEEFVIDGFGVLIAYNGAGGNIVIPDYVTAIGGSVFSENKTLTSVTFPAGVKNIGASAFFDCTNLTSITFAENSQLDTISPNAFAGTAISSLVIPASVKFIGPDAFGLCLQLKSVTFNAYPSDFFADVVFSFVGNAAPCSLTLPKGWGTDKPVAGSKWHGGWFEVDHSADFVIDENGVLTAYNGDDGDIVIPENVTAIGGSVFSENKTLTSVTFPAGVKNIGISAFFGCTNLKSITFAENSQLETIGDTAFKNTKITSVTIPASVETIGMAAFSDCSKLETVTFAEGSCLTAIGASAFYGNKITSVDIPAGVETIGGNAFGQCTSLTNVTFAEGSGLKTIGDNAFKATAFQAITLPEGLTTIGNFVFQDNEALQSITIPASVKTIGRQVFGWCKSLTSVKFLGCATLDAETFVSRGKTPCSLTLPANWPDDDKPDEDGYWHGGWFKLLVAPEAVEGLIYNGTEQTGVAGDEGYYTVTGGSAVDAGYYTATATLMGDYTWPDGSSEAKEIVWSIAKATPTADDFTYTAPENETPASVAFVGEDGKTGMGPITLHFEKDGSGDDSTDYPTEPGSYKVSVTVGEGDNYGPSAEKLSKDDWTFEIKAAVAAIGDTEYTSLQAAFDAAVAGETVKLLTNAEVTEQLLVRKGKTFNLDLAGFTVEYTGESLLKRGVIGIMYGGALTVQDSSSEKSGAIRSGSNAYAAISMTVPGDSNSESAVLTVKGGTLEGCYYGITGNGDRGNTKVFIQGGTVKGTDTGIYHPQSGMLVISGGTVEGATGVYAKAGSPITVSGGTVKGTGENVSFVHAGSGFNSTGDAFVVENCGYPGGAPVPAVTGGTFESSYAAPVASYAYGDNTPISGFVKGGSFNNTFDSDLVASGFALSEEPVEGYYSVEAEVPHSHSFGRWVYSDAETHTRVCSGCKEAEYGAHNYSKPVFQWTFPTNGDVRAVYHTSCTVCGHEVLGAEAELSEWSDEQFRYLTASVSIDGVPYSETKKVNLDYTVSFADGKIEYNGKKYTGTCSVPYGGSVKLIPKTSGKYDFYLDGILSAIGAKSLTIKVTGNTVATIAKHEDKAEPVVTMTTKRYIEGGKMKCSMQVDWATQSSAGITVKEAGLYYIYSTDGTEYNQVEKIIGVGKVKVSPLKCLNGYYTVTSNCAITSASYNKPLYSVGYVVYTDKSGKKNTIYTEVDCCQTMPN